MLKLDLDAVVLTGSLTNSLDLLEVVLRVGDAIDATH